MNGCFRKKKILASLYEGIFKLKPIAQYVKAFLPLSIVSHHHEQKGNILLSADSEWASSIMVAEKLKAQDLVK